MIPGRLLHPLLLACACLWPAVSTAAGDEVEEAFALLRAMNRAVDATTFRGVLVHVHQRDMDAIEILHQGGEQEYERLFSLTGEPREVIRTPQGVTCILPRQRTIMVDHSLPETPAANGLPLEPERLQAHYLIRMEGEDRVAGLRTLVVTLRPRDAFRYGHRFWVEVDTHLPLRSELFTREGELLARLMYASIEFLERLPDALLRPRLTGEGYRTYRSRPVEHPLRQEEGVSAPGMAVQVRWLPPGFRQQAHRRHGMPLSEAAVEHLLFSDGLASFSVYVEQAAQADAAHRLEGTAVMGSVHAAGRRVGDMHVTVVGEVPAVTVEKVAASIHPEQSP